MRSLKRLKNRRGDTLISILLAIMLVGGVSGFSIAHGIKIVKITKATTCKANIRNINLAIEIYAFKHRIEPTSVNAETMSFLIPDFLRTESVCPVDESSTYKIVKGDTVCTSGDLEGHNPNQD